MAELGGNLDFAEESLGPDRERQLRIEDFKSDLAVVFEVVGQVHDGRGSAAQLSLDRVKFGKTRAKQVRQIRHGGCPPYEAGALPYGNVTRWARENRVHARYAGPDPPGFHPEFLGTLGCCYIR